MDWYALEDGNENAGDGEADDEVVAPEEDAAELDDGEDAVLEEDTAVSFLSDMFARMCRRFGLWWRREGEERIHGVFDRCHGERVEEFKTVEDLEPAEQPLWAQDFKMSPEAIMRCC